MPSSLRIPSRYRPTIQALAELSEADSERLRDALRHAPSGLTTTRLAEQAREAIPNLPVDAEDLLDALMSLVAVLPEGDPAGSALARDVSESSDLELELADRHSLAERLEAFLSLEPLVLAARAADIVTEHEHVFHDARILTDLRPVFGVDASAGPRAAVVTATLKIESHEGDRSHRSYYFSLDHADLLHLKSVIDRALIKTSEMKRLIDRTDLPYWDYMEVPDAPET